MGPVGWRSGAGSVCGPDLAPVGLCTLFRSAASTLQPHPVPWPYMWQIRATTSAPAYMLDQVHCLGSTYANQIQNMGPWDLACGAWKLGSRGAAALVIATVPPLLNFQSCWEPHGPDHTAPWATSSPWAGAWAPLAWNHWPGGYLFRKTSAALAGVCICLTHTTTDSEENKGGE